MSASLALSEFKEGLTLLRNNYPGSALLHMRRAVELDNQNPYYLSFLGLTVATALCRWADAEVLCEAALKLKRNEPRFYLNLAEVYVKAGRRSDALETIRMGLDYTGSNPLLQTALGRLQMRRRRVIPFLRRGNPLNRRLGRLRHRVMGLFRASEEMVS
jgi:Flp pilus assembly protein TadD